MRELLCNKRTNVRTEYKTLKYAQHSLVYIHSVSSMAVLLFLIYFFMPNSEFCPRGLSCMPLNNLVSDCKTSCVCIGKHYEIKEGKESNDIYRHCFYNDKTDTMFDYDEYDLISIISVISNGLLTDKFLNK